MRTAKKLVAFLFFILPFYGMTQQGGLSILALGDSYTDGTSELKVNSWPLQLVSQLKKRKVQVRKPLIVAKPGWTTSNLLSAIETGDIPSDFDLVFLGIGVNNQYKGKDLDVFKTEFPVLLQKSIDFAKGKPAHVLVLSIPDWSVTPFARFKDQKKIIEELDTYNQIIQQETKKQGAVFLDITKVSRNAAVTPSLLAKDSLHPSKKMYKMWVKKMLKKIPDQ